MKIDLLSLSLSSLVRQHRILFHLIMKDREQWMRHFMHFWRREEKSLHAPRHTLSQLLKTTQPAYYYTTCLHAFFYQEILFPLLHQEGGLTRPT